MTRNTFLAAVEAGDAEEAKKAFEHAEKKLMQTAAKSTFQKNTVARKNLKITLAFIDSITYNSRCELMHYKKKVG